MFHVFPRRRRGTQWPVQCLFCQEPHESADHPTIRVELYIGYKGPHSLHRTDGWVLVSTCVLTLKKRQVCNRSTGNVPVTRIAGAMFAVGDKFLDSVMDKTYSDVLWNLKVLPELRIIFGRIPFSENGF